jgi:hypothetical protein
MVEFLTIVTVENETFNLSCLFEENKTEPKTVKN